MNRCERCCFYEYCTRTGRTEEKRCIYGNKRIDETDENESEDMRPCT